MIITRTPNRISLVGGGTDYPGWFENYGGLTVGGSIDKFSYVHARILPPYHQHKTRVVYSSEELVARNAEVGHRAVRAVLRKLGLDEDDSPGLEIFHAADLPGRCGVGSSSSFVVGLLHALSSLAGRPMLQHQLAAAAIDVEQNLMGESVGCQDQTFAAHGGLDALCFHRGGDVTVRPLPLSGGQVEALEAHLLLFFTGEQRTSSVVAATYAGSLGQRSREMWTMVRLAESAESAVVNGDYEALGGLVEQSWRIKSSLSSAVSTERASSMYAAARTCGAWGGKLTGAGGGGCMLLVCPPERQKSVEAALCQMGATRIPFRFEFAGSQIVFADRKAAA